MTEKPVALIVLAAGQGSRMQSDLPKVLHLLGGVPLVGHALAAGSGVNPLGDEAVEAIGPFWNSPCLPQNSGLPDDSAVPKDAR